MTCNNCDVCECVTPAETGMFFRTTYVLEVLSQDAGASSLDLATIAREMVHGDLSGHLQLVAEESISKEECAMALIDQGSDPGFFGIENVDLLADDPVPRSGPAMLYEALQRVLAASKKGYLKGLYGPLLYYINLALEKNVGLKVVAAEQAVSPD